MEYCSGGSLEKYINKLIDGKGAGLMLNFDFDVSFFLFDMFFVLENNENIRTNHSRPVRIALPTVLPS
jgi:hypothetical protein